MSKRKNKHERRKKNNRQLLSYLQHGFAPLPKIIFHSSDALCDGSFVKSKLAATLVQTLESVKLFEYSTDAVISFRNTPLIDAVFEIFRCSPTAYPMLSASSSALVSQLTCANPR